MDHSIIITLIIALPVAAVVTFITGLVAGALFSNPRHRAEVKKLKKQARAYRLQAVALKDLCRRLERLNQFPAPQPQLLSEKPNHSALKKLA
jgi:hypothetical protein